MIYIIYLKGDVILRLQNDGILWYQLIFDQPGDETSSALSINDFISHDLSAIVKYSLNCFILFIVKYLSAARHDSVMTKFYLQIETYQIYTAARTLIRIRCPNWYDLLRKKRINYDEFPSLVVF